MTLIHLSPRNEITKFPEEVRSDPKIQSRFSTFDKEKPLESNFYHDFTLRERIQSVQKKSLNSRREIWIAGALALGTIACLVVSLNLGNDVITPGAMATEISDVQEIETLTTLGGMSIEILEQLEHSSGVGLLNIGDSIKAILQKDWKTISILGITHFKLAQILKEIWDQADNSKLKKMSFYPDSLKSNFIGQRLTFQTLDISAQFPCKCIFDDPYTQFNKTWETPNYFDYLTITNSDTKQTIEVRLGMIDLIKKFGFYASGSARVDPVQLVSVLTGQDPANLQRKVDAASTA